MTNKEVQVGEYVRTKKHGIFKVLELYETENKYYILNNDKYEAYTIGGGAPRFDISKDIVNHSFNLKDLIEEGDFINGWKVLDIWDGDDKTFLTTSDDGYISKIYSVVTHEQFKAMEYKVGGENEQM